MVTTTHSDVETGCYYAPESYASVTARLVALLIDCVAFPVLLGLVGFVIELLPAPQVVDPDVTVLLQVGVGVIVCVVAAWLYFIELARTKFGTIGLRAMRIRVVDLKGGKPSWLQMLSRVTGGPLYELVRVPAERDKPTIGDKMAGLYVIKRDAKPAGLGPIVHDYCTMMGSLHWYFSEVKHG